MKLQQVVELNAELTRLLNDYKMPIISKFHLDKLLKSLEADNASFHAIRDNCIKENGVLNAETNQYFVLTDLQEKVFKEISGLLEQEVEIKLPSIKLSVFEKIEDTGKGNFPILFSLIEE